MITISEGQSQFSAWGHYAEPEALFINQAPKCYMAGQEINLDMVRGAEGTELHFDDGTVLLQEKSKGILPPLVGVVVWSYPEEGTIVPPDLKYVEIHASYTTKKGKVIKAQVDVPVAIPTEMRFVFPIEPLVNEGRYSNFQETWTDGTKTGFRNRFMPDAKLVVYWIDTEGDLAAYQVLGDDDEDNLELYVPFAVGGPPIEYEVGESTRTETVMRYDQVVTEIDGVPFLPEGTEIDIENSSGKLWAEYTIQVRGSQNPIVLRAETYFQTNPIIEWGYFNMPTSYTGTETLTLSINDHSRIVYKDGSVVVGQKGYDILGKEYWLSVWFRYKTVGGYWNDYDEVTTTFGDGRSGDVGQYCLYTRRDGSLVTKVSNRRIYNCSGGAIMWSEQSP